MTDKAFTPRYPTHVVVDTCDGYVFRSGHDGVLFTVDSAQAFADHRNAEMKPEYASYAVFKLVKCDARRPATQSERRDAARASCYSVPVTQPVINTLQTPGHS